MRSNDTHRVFNATGARDPLFDPSFWGAAAQYRLGCRQMLRAVEQLRGGACGLLPGPTATTTPTVNLIDLRNLSPRRTYV